MLIVGAFTTMATSLQSVFLQETEIIELSDTAPLHITLWMDAEIASDAHEISLNVAANVEGEERYLLRIVPDEAAIAPVELDTDTSVSHFMGQLEEHCETREPCALGFTIEVLEGEGPVGLEFGARATKVDEGGMCNSAPDDFSTGATMTVTAD